MQEFVSSPSCPISNERSEFLRDALAGLSSMRKTLPSKYFYDAAGSRLFDRICELDVYYPTRTELAIMQANAAHIADLLGDDVTLIEYGSGSSIKTRILLDHLSRPRVYIPVDISREHLMQSAARLAREYPQVPVRPLCADFTEELHVASAHAVPVRASRANDTSRAIHGRRVVYFPGSTIGNLTPAATLPFLRNVARVLGRDGLLLVGVDTEKDPRVLHRAYDDPQGVTAAFNANLLVRMNRELGADFVVSQFRHRAIYDGVHARIEMHLVSQKRQRVTIDGMAIGFTEDETILTEYSHKYSPERFAKLAAKAGFLVEHVFMDAEAMFSVQLLRVAPS